MADLTLDGGQLLLASEDDRTLNMRLVPYDEPCRSNLGRFTVGAGVLSIPADPSVAGLNDGHDRTKPLGRAVLMAERADGKGIDATFAVGRTPAGDQLLADVKAGKRRYCSVEANVVVEGGRAVSGDIFGAAIVSEGKRGAFPSAALYATEDQAVADPEDPTTAHYTTMNVDPTSGETFETETTVEETEETDPETGAQVITRTTTETTTITPGTPAEQDPTMTGPAVPAAPAAPLLAQVPDSLLPNRAARRAGAKRGKPAGVSTQALYAMLAASKSNPAARAMLATDPRVVGTLFAELEDVAYDGAGAPGVAIEQPQWLGELWSGKEYVRKFVPLFGHGDLTSFELQGWRWVDKPEMNEWDGNKADVPSGGMSTAPYTVRAKRFAGANDIAREYRDFNVTAFWDGYFRYMTESYAKLSDAYALTQSLSTVTVTIDDEPVSFKNYTDVAAGATPAGVSAVASKLVDGALQVIDSATPSWAIVGKADYRDLLLTRSDDTLAYLTAALGLEEGSLSTFRILPSTHPKYADGHVSVGAPSTGRFYELTQTPIRVEGLDMVHGGIDPGLFGYCAYVSDDPAAHAYVAPHAG